MRVAMYYSNKDIRVEEDAEAEAAARVSCGRGGGKRCLRGGM